MRMHRVMVVDDDPGVRKLVAATLGERDYEVVFAGDGEEAIGLARTQRPETIVLDVMMPAMDGFTACRKIKEHPATKDIPVVLLTARGGFDDRVQGDEARADAYLTKPFSPLTLLKTVEHMLELVEQRSAVPDRLSPEE